MMARFKVFTLFCKSPPESIQILPCEVLQKNGLVQQICGHRRYDLAIEWRGSSNTFPSICPLKDDAVAINLIYIEFGMEFSFIREIIKFMRRRQTNNQDISVTYFTTCVR